MSFPPRQPARSEIKPGDMDAYNFVIERARHHSGAADPETNAGYYGRLLLSPQSSSHLCQLGQYFRAVGDGDDSYSHADREFVDQVLGVDFKTNIVAMGHINDAVSAGVRIEAIEALRYGREQDLTDDEKLLASFIRKVIAGTMDAETWKKMEGRIGERGAVDYACFVLFLQTTMRGIQLSTGGREPSDEQVDQLIADIKSGKHEIDDYRKRIS
jgi:hypothetical protein